MMSNEFLEIQNICNLAKHHKATCNEENCGVSLSNLKLTVIKLLQQMTAVDKYKAQSLVNQVEWY